MMIRLVQIITEYVGIILCLHTFAKVKKEVNIYNILFCVLDIVLVVSMDKYPSMSLLLKAVLFLMFLLYVLCCLEKKLGRAFKIWGYMMVMIPSLQLGGYFVLKVLFKGRLNDIQVSIIVNLIICIFMYCESDRVVKEGINFLRKRMKLMLIVFFLFSMLYLFGLYMTNGILQAEIIFLVAGGIWAVILLLELFITAENERKNKEKELQLYQIYNKSFESAIVMIRERQHEFDNHINAIKHMQYAIEDVNKFREEQLKYCDNILKQNSLNGLLKMDIEPIVIGALYSKLVMAQNAGIEVKQRVHTVDFRSKIDIAELIEIIGILIDNAVEALQDNIFEPKILNVQIIAENEKYFSIEIANTSRKISNSEIEKFCRNGYSTKGINRGVGIPRLLAIVKKNQAELAMRNISCDGLNYFSVKVLI